MNKRIKKFLFLVATASLLPGVALAHPITGVYALTTPDAPAAQPSVRVPEEQVLKSKDFLAEDLKSIFNIKVEIKSDPASNHLSAEFSGLIFEDCLAGAPPNSVVEAMSAIPTDGQNKYGFRINDPGNKIRSCLKNHRGQHCNRYSAHQKCVLITSHLDLSAAPTGTVGLLSDDPAQPAEEGQYIFSFQDFAPPVKFKSLADIQKDQADARAAAVDAQKKKYEDEFKRLQKKFPTCLNTRSGIDTLETELARFENMSEFSENIQNYYEKIEKAKESLEKKEIAKAFADLKARADKDPLDSLDTLHEDLRSWLDKHPKDADQVADIFIKIAGRFVKDNSKRPGAWDQAAAVIRKALELPGLSENKRMALAKLIKSDIPLAKGMAIASYGMANNMLLGPYYYNLMQQMSNNVMEACNGSGSANGMMFNPFGGEQTDPFAAQVTAQQANQASLEGCSAEIGGLRAAAGLPGLAQGVDQQRAQMSQQMNQSIAQATMGGAVNGAAGINPMANPYNNNSINTGASPMAYAGGQYGLLNGPPQFKITP